LRSTSAAISRNDRCRPFDDRRARRFADQFWITFGTRLTDCGGGRHRGREVCGLGADCEDADALRGKRGVGVLFERVRWRSATGQDLVWRGDRLELRNGKRSVELVAVAGWAGMWLERHGEGC
jgi:hypothetical protein